jgi:hypothetical protein
LKGEQFCEGKAMNQNLNVFVGVLQAFGHAIQRAKNAYRTWRGRTTLHSQLGANFDDPDFRGTRSQILQQILCVSDPDLYWFSAGKLHVPKDDHGHDHHSSAIVGNPYDQRVYEAAFKMFLKPSTRLDDRIVQDHDGLPISHSVFCSGGPNSNAWIQQYVPCWRKETVRGDGFPMYDTVLHPQNVPYHFLIAEKPVVKFKSAVHTGPFPVHGVLVESRDPRRRRPWYPGREEYQDQSGWLTRDFVLISRLPRLFEGGAVLSIAGGHGFATQAFELLFEENAFARAELEFLQVQLAKFNRGYFQFVLEVDEIKHNGNESVASRVSVCRELPPIEVFKDVELFKFPLK